jgi:hypothetical protein
MIPYDPQLIQRFAAHRCLVAKGMVLVYVLAGVVIGGIAGLAVGRLVGDSGAAGIHAAVGAVLIGLAGFPTGLEKSFKMRAEAQRLLCMLQIEENSRRPA